MQAAAMMPVDDPDVTPYDAVHAMVGKLRFLAGMIVSILIFWYVGYWAARSGDPLAPISLLNVDQGVIAMAELLGLAVVAGGLAVAICGARSADRGALAIALGLAALGLRGTQMDKLVLYRLDAASPTAGISPFPTAALVAETWLWLALIAVGFVVGRWVESWFEPDAVPVVPVDHAPDVRHGLGGVAIVALVAWAIISYAIGGPENPLLKGQIYFAIGIGFLIGSMIANWLFEIHSRVWMLAAVAIVATAAYLFAGPDSQTLAAARQSGGYVTLRPIVRALPIEYAALGAVGVLLERDAVALLRALFGLQPADQSRDR